MAILSTIEKIYFPDNTKFVTDGTTLLIENNVTGGRYGQVHYIVVNSITVFYN